MESSKTFDQHGASLLLLLLFCADLPSRYQNYSQFVSHAYAEKLCSLLFLLKCAQRSVWHQWLCPLRSIRNAISWAFICTYIESSNYVKIPCLALRQLAAFDILKGPIMLKMIIYSYYFSYCVFFWFVQIFVVHDEGYLGYRSFWPPSSFITAGLWAFGGPCSV